MGSEGLGWGRPAGGTLGVRGSQESVPTTSISRAALREVGQVGRWVQGGQAGLTRGRAPGPPLSLPEWGVNLERLAGSGGLSHGEEASPCRLSLVPGASWESQGSEDLPLPSRT